MLAIGGEFRRKRLSSSSTMFLPTRSTQADAGVLELRPYKSPLVHGPCFGLEPLPTRTFLLARDN